MSAGDEAQSPDLHFGCTTVTRAQIEALRVRLTETAMQGQVSLEDAQQRMIQRLVAQRLAPSVRVEISDAEVDESLAAAVTQNGITVPELETMLAAHGSTLAAYRDELRNELLRFRVGAAILDPPAQAVIDAEVERRMSAAPAGTDRAIVEHEVFLMFTLQAMDAAYTSRAREWAETRVERVGDACAELEPR